MLQEGRAAPVPYTARAPVTEERISPTGGGRGVPGRVPIPDAEGCGPPAPHLCTSPGCEFLTFVDRLARKAA